MRLVVVAAVLTLSVPALAQQEGTPETCNDGHDNDHDGFTDCDDMKCRNVGVCFMPVQSTGEEKLSARAQITAGAIMLVVGPAVAAGSSAVFLDGVQQDGTKRAVELTMGGVMAAAGAAIGIGGALTLRKGILRHREDVEMGLALGPTRASLLFRF